MGGMATAESYVLAIGTKKGLWLATSPDRKDWSLSGPHFLMSEVPSIGIDTRDGRTRILVGVRSEHWGPTVFHSDDLGETWNEPEQGAIRFPEGTDAALERVWQIHPDAESRPGVVWAGCEPISVWKSTDGGEHFELNRGLWDHPHRSEWGAGYGGAAAHSIVVDHTGEKVHVAMSTGGVYRSLDGGSSWEPRNKGISAYFMPDPNPEFGQCVHKIAADAAVDGRLYAQNHHGVYRSDDDAENWESIADGLPADFGFVMLTHPAAGRHRLGDPAQGGRRDGSRRRANSRSTGPTTPARPGSGWTPGCPKRNSTPCFGTPPALTRQSRPACTSAPAAAASTPAPTRARHFAEVASHLPDVLCVRAAAVSAAASVPLSGGVRRRREAPESRGRDQCGAAQCAPAAGRRAVLPDCARRHGGDGGGGAGRGDRGVPGAVEAVAG